MGTAILLRVNEISVFQDNVSNIIFREGRIKCGSAGEDDNYKENHFP
jgi:hypothetical protein